MIRGPILAAIPKRDEVQFAPAVVGAVVPAPTAHRERKAMRRAEGGIIEIEVNGSALFGRLLSDT